MASQDGGTDAHVPEDEAEHPLTEEQERLGLARFVRICA